MTIRSITAAELDWFAGMVPNSDWLNDALTGFWSAQPAGGVSSPDWCFVAEECGQPVGRVAWFALPSSRSELLMLSLHALWQADYLAVGTEMLKESLARMRTLGAASAEARVRSNSPNRNERKRLLEAAGFGLVQEKCGFEWKDAGVPVAVSDRLNFRSLAEVGEPAFVHAVQRVTEGTLDRDLLAEVRAVGAEKQAQQYFNTIRDTDFHPDWWQLGLLPDGTLAGLIVPQKFGDWGAGINYIGVVPELRGRGYVNDLLAKGTAILQANGFTTSLAEIDSLNTPLATALARAGYKHETTFWVYKRRLT